MGVAGASLVGKGSSADVLMGTDLLQTLRYKKMGGILTQAKLELETIFEEEAKLLRFIQILREKLQKSSRRTEAHNYSVGELCKKIAEAMGLPIRQVLLSAISGYIHDIGKTAIPLSIWKKKKPLTSFECEMIEKHVQFTEEMVRKYFGDEFPELLQAARSHHERWDGLQFGVGKGSGYPDGLKGKEIPLLARIVSVADVYDAMTKDRPYSKAMEKEFVIDYIKSNSGKKFDPKVVRAFLEIEL